MNGPLLQNSLLVAGATTALAVGLGLVAALWLATLAARGRTAFLALAVVALALPPFLVTNCWISLLGDTGVLRAWLPFRIYSLGGTIWILSLMLWPITLFAVLSAWRRLEAAQLECEPTMTGFALLRWLLIPVARGELALAAVVTFVLALNNFAVPAILQTKVLPDEMWVRFNTQFDTLGTLKLSLPLVLAPVILLAWASRRGVRWPRVQGAVAARVFRRQLGSAWQTGCGAIASLLCVLSVGLPLAQIALAKRTWRELPGAVEAGTGAIWNSFWFAALAATVVIAVALATAAVVFQRRDAARRSRNRKRARKSNRRGTMRRRGFALKFFLCVHRASAVGWLFQESSQAATKLGDSTAENAEKTQRSFSTLRLSAFSASLRLSLVWLPFFIPGVVLGIALIHLFNNRVLGAIYQSAGIVVLAFVIRYFAVGWTAARHAIGGVDADLTDAARLEGASRWQLLRHVVWPQIAPQVFAAWYVVYLLCLWDVESMVVIVPPGCETLALRIFNLLHYGYAAQVNALCLTLLGLAVLPLVVVAAYVRTRQFLANYSRGEVGRALTNAAAITTVALVAGCSPSDSKNEAALQSKLFERALVIGSRGVGIGEFNKPRSVAVDSQDNVYAADMTGRVQKFSPEGKFLLSWQMPQTDLGKPKGMGRDREGNILVIEPHYQRVNHFTPGGKWVAQWGCRGTNEGCFILPRGIAQNSRREFLVSEYMGAERVQRFALPVQSLKPKVQSRSDGGTSPLTPALSPSEGEREDRSPLLVNPVVPRLLSVLGKAGTGPGEFNRAEGICVDAQDRLYVADSCNHRIQIFSAEGKFIRQYGRAGSGLGELSYPYDIAVDADGYQFVCEFGNSRIQVFNANCQPVEIIGGPGAAPGRFANPWGVALDSHGNLVVADALNHRLQKLVRRRLKSKGSSLKSAPADARSGLQTSAFSLQTAAN